MPYGLEAITFSRNEGRTDIYSMYEDVHYRFKDRFVLCKLWFYFPAWFGLWKPGYHYKFLNYCTLRLVLKLYKNFDLFNIPSVPRNDKINMRAVRQKYAIRMVSRCIISQSYRLLLLTPACFIVLLCFSKRVRDVETYLVQLKSGTIRLPHWVSSHRIQKILFYLFIHRLGHRCAASFDDLAHCCINNYPILIFHEVFKFPETLSMGWESNFKSSKRYISNNMLMYSLTVYILQSSVRNQWIFLHKLTDWDSCCSSVTQLLGGHA